MPVPVYRALSVRQCGGFGSCVAYGSSKESAQQLTARPVSPEKILPVYEVSAVP